MLLLILVVGLTVLSTPAAHAQRPAPGTIEQLETILLQRYRQAGITAANVLQPSTKDKLEAIINSLWNAEDFNTETFYTRELRAGRTLSPKMQQDWRAILQALDFADELETERETDWRAPFDRVNSLCFIYRLYDNAGYGDTWHYITRTMTDHMALYILFSPPARRAKML